MSENPTTLVILGSARLGFRQEGFGLRYLGVEGEWRDHERWAILAEERPSRDAT